MMSLVLVIATVLMVVLIVFTANVGRVVAERHLLQNTADSVAYSSTLMMTRGMNAITATNHLMGEMMAFVTIHEAIGGYRVDGRELSSEDRRKAQILDRLLPGLAEAASNVGGWTVAYDDVVKEVRAAATAGQAKIRLKANLAKLYAMQVAASEIPYVGQAIVQALNAVEVVLLGQWKAIDALERLARATVPVKRLLFEVLLPAAKDYEDEVVRVMPDLAADTAREIARLSGCEGSLFPAKPELPVVQERINWDAGHPYLRMQNSQILRATYPWVKYHRKPILDVLEKLDIIDLRYGGPFNLGSQQLYRHWVTVYTARMGERFYQRVKSTIYVLPDPLPRRKGSELWTRDSLHADRHFALIGLVRRESPIAFGNAVFGEPSPEGVVGMAQGLIYNAGSQRPAVGPPVFQREVAWDTLNWKAPATESFAYEFKQSDGRFGMPRIELNWQAKLVPITDRLNEARGRLPASLAPLSRILPADARLRVH